MNPLLESKRARISHSVLWLIIGALLACVLIFSAQASPLGALAFALPAMLVLGTLSASAYYVSANFNITQRRFSVAVLLSLSAVSVASFFWILLCALIEKTLHLTALPNTTVQLTGETYLSLCILAAITYALSVFIYDALLTRQALTGVETRETARNLWARDTELKALRAQINPHFLFNSLNSISALTSINPSKARDMIIQLSQFFRETLSTADSTLITLSKELEICEHFLQIEKLRYGDKLQINYHLDTQLLNSLIPPLCLQPLLENAIKHGASLRTETSAIEVEIQQQQQRLYLIVTNAFSSHNTFLKPEGTNTGLPNLQARLALLYHGQALVHWQKSDTHFRVEIILPLAQPQGYSQDV
jgi:two-component system, LytTR family, sensor histidine kinase AlgZ